MTQWLECACVGIISKSRSSGTERISRKRKWTLVWSVHFDAVEYYQHNHFHQRGNYDLINFRRMTPQEPHSSQFFPSMAASMVFSFTFTSILQVDRNHPHQHQNGIQVEPRPLWLALIQSRSISWTCPSLHGLSPTSQGDTNDCQKINIISPGTNTLLRNM